MQPADPTAPLPLDRGLFGQLRSEAGGHGRDYVKHRFVAGPGAGTLQPAAFRCYLLQD